MTMPVAAAAVKEMGSLLPNEMSEEQLACVVDGFREDLGNETVVFVEAAIPESKLCECGALHLQLNDPKLSDGVRHKLLRLVASPFGQVVAQQHGFSALRFGWDGLEQHLPEFMAVVDRHGVRLALASSVSDEALDEIIAVIRLEVPGVLEMIEASASAARAAGGYRSYAVTPAQAGSTENWQQLIGRLMLAGATPVRKFIDEHLRRRFGVYGGVVNCCVYPAEPIESAGTPDGFARRRWFEQVNQQLTPDC